MFDRDIAVFYFPVQTLEDGEYLALNVGEAELEVGDMISLKDSTTRKEIHDLYVVAVDTFPANDLPEGILQDLNVKSEELFQTALHRSFKTALPADVLITLYRFSPDEDAALLALNDLAYGDDVEARSEEDDALKRWLS